MIPKLLVTTILTACCALYVAELSGRWDQSLRDANDEAGLVGIVLCVGAAVASIAAFVARVLPLRRRFGSVASVTCGSIRQVCLLPASLNTGPPLNLRV
jgi:hypothetical protein